ncbi:MAG TPA: transcriptional repressor NrdR [Candidatus Merdivicinus excrementipullorum]|uniref:Transcriptional repressor NrdR n=1 Tax=Candidatus Merdivicinus excrementipullorum TaxID=2840867 RepID=A0A9D1FLZ3_9FIRM|nr:transcriptional repressor NrdR [Candidatus Merdivicinus excrementipullorum]
MKCPYCSYTESKVVDSRPAEDSEKIRRRRECLSCGRRFTTYEAVENTPLVVVKKDKSRQLFDREKLLRGLLRACEKRPVSMETLERFVDSIEQNYANEMVKEVSSVELGEYVLRELKKLDKVAYIRFASVYRDFSDVDSFLVELKKLQEED